MKTKALIAIETIIIFFLVTVTPLFLYFFIDEATNQVVDVVQTENVEIENIQTVTEEELEEMLSEVNSEEQIVVEITSENEDINVSEIDSTIAEEEISQLIEEEVENIVTEEIELPEGHGTAESSSNEQYMSNEQYISEEESTPETPEEESTPETPEDFQIITGEGSGSLDYTMLANAGSDQTVFEYDNVTLNAFESPGAVSYAWVCEMDGSPITLTNADSRLATFRAPLLSEDKVINCTLTVTDLFDNSFSKTDLVRIDITNGPIADAGIDQIVEEVETVHLVSSSEGAGLVYSWDCNNDNVIIQNANTANAFFSAPFVSEDTSFDCILTVRDLGGEIDQDEVNITILNGPIVISQGDIVVEEGGEINLNANSSIGAISSYAWACDNGFMGIPTTNSAYFLLAPQVEANTLYNCSVTATDLIGDTNTDTFTIHVLNYEETYSSPRVYFNPYERDVVEGTEVTLYPTIISEIPVYGYYWTCTFNGTPLTLSNQAARNPKITIPYVNESGKKIVCSVVAYNDSGAGGASQSLNIINGPIANAGSSQTKQENQNVTLSGSYTGNISSVNWSCDNDILLTNSDTLYSTFTTPFVDSNTTITCTLEVEDYEGKTDIDTVEVNILNGPLASVSNMTIREGNIGTISNSSIGDITSYDFSCEDEDIFTLSNTSSRYPTVVASSVDENTSKNCTLLIEDSEGKTDSTSFIITVANYVPPTYTYTTPTSPTTPIVPSGENEGQQEDGGGFFAEVSSDGTITLVWEKGENTTHTYIKRMQDNPPSSLLSGDLIYFNTGENCQDPELPLGNTYCYSAWGYNSNQDVYSESYASVCILVDLNIVSVEKYLLETTEYIRVNANTIGLAADLGLRYKKASVSDWTYLTPREGISSGMYTFEIPNLEPGGVTYDYEVILEAGENSRTYTDTFVSEVVPPTISNTEALIINAEKAQLSFDLDNGGALTEATIELADNIDFNESTIITLEDQYTDTIIQTFNDLIQNTTYFYKINAMNEKGYADEISGSFTTEALIKDISIDNILTKEATLNFTLNTDDTSASLNIEYADNPEFTDLETISLVDEIPGEIIQTIDNLIQNTTYYLRIEVLDKENQDELTIHTFNTLDIQITIDNFNFSRLTQGTLSAVVLPEQTYSYLWQCDEELVLTNSDTATPGITTPDVNEDTTYNCSVEVSDAVNSSSANFTITAIAMEEGWIAVPGNDIYGTSDFLVMKYEAKNVSGEATSQADLTPWASISQIDAKTECEQIGAHLITNEEWMTIARNIESVSFNWTGGSVGSGMLKRGNVRIVDDGSYNGSDPEYGVGRDTKAQLVLSNGETLWDFSGNVAEWVDKTLETTELPDYAEGWREINSITYTTALPYLMVGPLDSALTSVNGIGQFYTDNGNSYPSSTIHAFLRGGHAGEGNTAGIFGIGVHNSPLVVNNSIGFRCVKSLAPTVSSNSVTDLTSKSADISFTLDTGEKDYADVTITYSVDSSYTSYETLTLSSEMSGSLLSTISSLIPETTYYYKIEAVSEKGESNTIEGTFTTEAIVLNTSTSILTSTADIFFDLNTNEADISLTYADNIEYTDSEVVTFENQTEGQITISLSNLIQGTTYYYQLDVVDIDTYTYSNQDTITTDTISVSVTDYNVATDTNTDLSAIIIPEQDYTYLWQCDGGELTNLDTATPYFTSGSEAGTYNCSLTISDGTNEGSDGFVIGVEMASEPYYVFAGGTGGLYAYEPDLINGGLIQVGYTSKPTYIGLAYYDGYIYASNGAGGITIYTFDGANFTEKASINYGKYNDFTFDGTYFYAGEDGHTFYAFEFDGNSIVQRGSYSKGKYGITGIRYSNGYIFVTQHACTTINAYIFDGSTFTEVGSHYLASWGGYGVEVKGSYIFAPAYADEGVLKIFTFDGSTFNLIATSGSVPHVNRVAIDENNYLYMKANAEGVKVGYFNEVESLITVEQNLYSGSGVQIFSDDHMFCAAKSASGFSCYNLYDGISSTLFDQKSVATSGVTSTNAKYTQELLVGNESNDYLASLSSIELKIEEIDKQLSLMALIKDVTLLVLVLIISIIAFVKI